MKPTGSQALASTISGRSAHSPEFENDFTISELLCSGSTHSATLPEHLFPGKRSDFKVSHRIGRGREYADSLPEYIDPGPMSCGIFSEVRFSSQMRSEIFSDFTFPRLMGVVIVFSTRIWQKEHFFMRSKMLRMSVFLPAGEVLLLVKLGQEDRRSTSAIQRRSVRQFQR